MYSRVIPLIFTLLLLAGVVAVQAADGCPLCGGDLTKIGRVIDDRSKPSKNLSVWNRSICGMRSYGDDSVICTQCWLAQSKPTSGWERSSEFPDSFRRPLSSAVLRFPLPPLKDIRSGVIYSQQINGGKVTESLLFWLADSPTRLDSLRTYCRENRLSMAFYRSGKEVCITITGKPKS